MLEHSSKTNSKNFPLVDYHNIKFCKIWVILSIKKFIILIKSLYFLKKHQTFDFIY